MGSTSFGMSDSSGTGGLTDMIGRLEVVIRYWGWRVGGWW